MSYQEKRDYFNNIESYYSSNGSVTGETFKNDQHCNKCKVVFVDNKTFAEGTLRVTVPCLIKLKEDIYFNPNRDYDWMPTKQLASNNQYFVCDAKFAYNLGFFAAIAIETCDVIIDLNGHSLQQHSEHALQQRFYANIELADQPFIPMQGPSNFGNKLKSANKVLIHNGVIGTSSHHGVHGNGSNKIIFENLVVKDFEVAAISINDVNDIDFYKVTVPNNRHNIPVLGTYSAARFIKFFVQHLKDCNITSPALESAMTELNFLMSEAFNAIINNIGTVPVLFRNDSGLIDGNAYGIVVNKKGVAVGGYTQKRSDEAETSDIHLYECHVNNILGNINEIVAITHPNGGVQVDTAGAILQFFDNMFEVDMGKHYYVGTTLSNVQIELAKLKETAPENKQKYFGTMKIHKGIQDWKCNGDLYFRLAPDNTIKLYNIGDVPYIVNGSHVSYGIVCNGDTMHHVNKGMIGMRFEGVHKLYLNRCSVKNVSNSGEKGSLLCGPYVNSISGQNLSMVGYQGAKAYGIIMCATETVKAKDTHIENIESKKSSAFGLTIMNDPTHISFTDTKIKGIKSNVGEVFNGSCVGLPNEAPVSRGLKVGHDCKHINFNNTEVTDIQNSEGNPYHLDYDLHCKVHFE
jgi:hypothetical protein